MAVKHLAFVAASVAILGMAGCGRKEVMSSDVKPPDPYAGMTKEQKLKAIQDDPKIGGMQKQSMIDKVNAGG